MEGMRQAYTLSSFKELFLKNKERTRMLSERGGMEENAVLLLLCNQRSER
jgi:hypothetical protein